MKDYKIIASKIERFDYREYIKARIYLEIQDLDIDHDTFVDYGFQVWSNSEHLSAEEIGIAIHYGMDYHDTTDPAEVFSKGIDYLRK